MTSASVSASTIPPLKTLTLDQIATGLDNRRFTVVQLVQAHLDQIARFDGYLHAVLQINPRAVAIAEALDIEFQKSGRRGILHGVPVLIKDNIATHEALEATAGSLALVGAKPHRESPVVAKLRDAGCVILGTTNCSEWANFRSRPSDSGWSARGGQTYGAYHEKMDPSGSSSGSGVAVDMGFCVLAVGTETSGSIICPSNQNNIVGLKPTVGLVSRDSIVPLSPEQDTAGPMARTVADAAALLTAISGRDEHDQKTRHIPFAKIPDYRAVSVPSAFPRGKPVRLGIPRDVLQDLRPSIVKAFEDRVVAPLHDKFGVEMVDCHFPGLQEFQTWTLEQRNDYMAGEFHDAMPAYLDSLEVNPQHIDSLEALCTFTKNTPAEEYGEGRNLVRIEQSIRVSRDSTEFAAAKKSAVYLAGPGGIQGALDGNGDAGNAVDALLVPSSASPANFFAASQGHPQFSLPLGYLEADMEIEYNDSKRLVLQGPNIPFGVSLIGRKFSEETLLPICAVIEELTQQTRGDAEAKRVPYLRG